MTVLIYVDTSKQVGDRDDLKMFAMRTPRKLGLKTRSRRRSLRV